MLKAVEAVYGGLPHLDREGSTGPSSACWTTRPTCRPVGPRPPERHGDRGRRPLPREISKMAEIDETWASASSPRYTPTSVQEVDALHARIRKAVKS